MQLIYYIYIYIYIYIYTSHHSVYVKCIHTHEWMRYVTRRNQSCYTYEWVMWHRSVTTQVWQQWAKRVHDIHEIAWYTYNLQRALSFLKRTLCIRKRALYIPKRALYISERFMIVFCISRRPYEGLPLTWNILSTLLKVRNLRRLQVWRRLEVWHT